MFIKDKDIPNSLEFYISKISSRTQAIYIIVITCIVIGLILLPIIKIELSCQASGLVRPASEKVEIVAPVSERIETVNVREGQSVKKGQLLIRFKSKKPEFEKQYQQSELTNIRNQIADLSKLAKGSTPRTFHSHVYKEEYQLYEAKKKNLEREIAQAKIDFSRFQVLYEKQLISQSEYETQLNEYEDKQNELIVLSRNQISQWTSALNNYRKQEIEINSALNQTQETQEQSDIYSPIDGTIDQFSGIYEEAFIPAGHTLAIISPDSSLYVESYVTPANIGYLKIGQSANIQISSFNYKQWGMITGKITDISSDYINNGSGDIFYRVKCSLDRDYLTFKRTKKKGHLKKGMTAVVHFNMDSRSLWDLLYQSFDELVNPTQYSNNPD